MDKPLHPDTPMTGGAAALKAASRSPLRRARPVKILIGDCADLEAVLAARAATATIHSQKGK